MRWVFVIILAIVLCGSYYYIFLYEKKIVLTDELSIKELAVLNCDNGFGSSCFNLAFGIFGALDKHDTVLFYEKACNEGIDIACDVISKVYLDENKIEKARLARQRACSLGSSIACATLIH
ncbi:hypothetical protein [Campylobacter geochelonis]|uniref:hypothetical protein n=1 Tax=Campylobacter geochelonis TaxID=1780362 RepID=UPI0007709C95|nr:hypothetical protein [Campylobacter geochelonis]CZE50852.1 Putative beta-lactamase hcpD precursor [Campylobacter geochelonis]